MIQSSVVDKVVNAYELNVMSNNNNCFVKFCFKN